jgi:CBS domain-containing protein
MIETVRNNIYRNMLLFLIAATIGLSILTTNISVNSVPRSAHGVPFLRSPLRPYGASHGMATTKIPAVHPTVLTLTATLNRTELFLRGKLTDTITSSGVGGATIRYTFTPKAHVHTEPLPTIPEGTSVTTADGTFIRSIFYCVGTYQVAQFGVQAHFAGGGTYGPSNSPIHTFWAENCPSQPTHSHS